MKHWDFRRFQWIFRCFQYKSRIWLVVSAHLKNIGQNGNLPQFSGWKKKKWNHHPGIESTTNSSLWISASVSSMDDSDAWQRRTYFKGPKAHGIEISWWMPICYLILLNHVGPTTPYKKGRIAPKREGLSAKTDHKMCLQLAAVQTAGKWIKHIKKRRLRQSVFRQLKIQDPLKHWILILTLQ